VGRVAQSVWRLVTGWTVRGSNPGGGEIFRTCPDRPWGPPSLLHNGYRVFPGGKKRLGRDVDASPLLVPWSRKSRAIPLLTLLGYDLYRASVPVQGCTLPFFLPTLQSTLEIQIMANYHIYSIFVLILFFHLRLGLASGLFASSFPTKNTLNVPLLFPHGLPDPHISIILI